jgi:uncharacterized protein with von Willebrand factor type A (vWA) domain
VRIGDLLSRARDLIRRSAPVRNATDAVRQDTYDHDLFNELLIEAPALAEVVARLGQDVDYAPDIVRDTLMQFWKGDPHVRARAEMDERRLVQHAVATDVQGSDDLAEARSYTQHDRYGAAMATIGVSKKVHEFARKHGQAIEDAKREKEEAEQAEQEAREAAEQAAEALEPDDEGSENAPITDPDFHGPLTTEQQAVVDALEAAVTQLGQAQRANEQATQQLEDQAVLAQQALAVPVDAAITEAAEKLEEEQQLFSMWGVSDGELQEMDFEQRAALAATLRENKMSKFVDLIGRFKLMAAAQRVKKVEYGRDQVVGVELSNDLSRVVMAELSNLAMGDDDLAEMLELDFYRRLAEGQLLSKEYVGEEKVGKGAIICLLDNSGSMSIEHQGVTREAWGKALALAALDTARRQGRQFVGINFSSRRQVSVHRFIPGHYAVTDVLRFAQEFWGGGTDFEAPLDRAIEVLEDEFNGKGKEKGDLMLVTDGECGVNPNWMTTYLARKQKLNFRTFGILIGDDGGDRWDEGTLAALSDNVRNVTEFQSTEEVRDIFQVV